MTDNGAHRNEIWSINQGTRMLDYFCPVYDGYYRFDNVTRYAPASFVVSSELPEATCEPCRVCNATAGEYTKVECQQGLVGKRNLRGEVVDPFDSLQNKTETNAECAQCYCWGYAATVT